MVGELTLAGWLESDSELIVVNDHDPTPLYHQFEVEAGDEFHWEYRQQGPSEFRIRIGKNATTTTDASQPERPDVPV